MVQKIDKLFVFGGQPKRCH